MKKLMLVILVVSLLLAPLLMQIGRIERVNASPSTNIFADATDGYLDSNGIVYSTYPQMSLGDWSNDAYSHCYVKFSLSGVSGALSSATLNLYVYISYHDNNSYAASPLTNPGLGDCQVIHIADYGTIDSSDFSAASIGNDPGVLLSGSATPNVGYVSIDVRAAMQDDMNHGRAWSTFMLRMSTTTDGNSDNDYWVFYTSRDASPAHHPYVAYDLAPVYQGDLILTGNNVTTIAGRFDINGSIIVKENATLILKNAIIDFTQAEDWEFGVFLRDPSNGNPRLEVANTTITSNHKFSIKLYQNSSAIVHDCQLTALPGFYCWLWTYDSSTASFYNLTVHGLSSRSGSGVLIFNSTIVSLNIYDPCVASSYNSTIDVANGYGSSLISIDKSTIGDVQAFDSTVFRISDSAIDGSIYGYNETAIWLTNSTYGDSATSNQSKVFECWYLDIHVIDSIGQNVPSANVTGTNPNATIADSKLTDANGWAKIVLTEKIVNATGAYPVGNYTVEASYLTYSNGTTVNMTGNKQTTLTLDGLVIPEFPSFLILASFMTAALLTVAVCKRKKWKLRLPFSLHKP